MPWDGDKEASPKKTFLDRLKEKDKAYEKLAATVAQLETDKARFEKEARDAQTALADEIKKNKEALAKADKDAKDEQKADRDKRLAAEELADQHNKDKNKERDLRALAEGKVGDLDKQIAAAKKTT